MTRRSALLAAASSAPQPAPRSERPLAGAMAPRWERRSAGLRELLPVPRAPRRHRRRRAITRRPAVITADIRHRRSRTEAIMARDRALAPFRAGRGETDAPKADLPRRPDG